MPSNHKIQDEIPSRTLWHWIKMKNKFKEIEKEIRRKAKEGKIHKKSAEGLLKLLAKKSITEIEWIDATLKEKKLKDFCTGKNGFAPCIICGKFFLCNRNKSKKKICRACKTVLKEVKKMQKGIRIRPILISALKSKLKNKLNSREIDHSIEYLMRDGQMFIPKKGYLKLV